MSMRTRVVAWIDERFPLTAFIRHQMTEYPTPKNISYWWNFGSLAMFVLVVQLVTGIFLAMHYKADANMAFDSIQHIMREVNYGWLIRYMHTTGASAFFIVIYLHMGRTLYYGSFRAPRELLWWSGQILLLALMASAFMGYLLPWGQLSYWGASVITNLFGAVPLIGEDLVVWMRGGYAVGDPTLTRFFALHFLVPFLIAGLVVIHLVSLHHVRSSNPTGIDLKEEDNIPFHPYFTAKDAYGLGVFLIAYCALVFFAPDLFIEKENYIPADPFLTPAHIVPEWYFLPFYTILRSIPNLLGGVVAMNVAILIFAAMPYLDRSRIPGGGRYRPIYRGMFFLFVIDTLALGYLGMHQPDGVYLIMGQICTFIYFAIFVLLPPISIWEEKWLRKRGLPADIEALLGEARS